MLARDTRHVVYSYLRLKETLKIAALSKDEKASLQRSHIARKDKRLMVILDQRIWPTCLLHDGNLDKFLQRFKLILSFTDHIHIRVSFEESARRMGKRLCNEHNIAEEIAAVICALPQRFDCSKVWFCIIDSKIKLDLQLFLQIIDKHRPELSFSGFSMNGLALTTNQISSLTF